MRRTLPSRRRQVRAAGRKPRRRRPGSPFACRRSAGKGVTDQRHWGLAQVLWATQGNLRIADLSAETRTTLQEALGGQIAGPGADVVEKRIADAYAQFFTRTGKLKTGAAAPAFVRLQKELEALQQRREKLQERLEEFEAASRRIEDLRSKAAATHLEETELTEQLRQTREQALVYKDLLSQQKLHHQEVANAEERYRTLSDRIQAIASCRKDIEATSQQLERLREDAPAQAADCRAMSADG